MDGIAPEAATKQVAPQLMLTPQELPKRPDEVTVVSPEADAEGLLTWYAENSSRICEIATLFEILKQRAEIDAGLLTRAATHKHPLNGSAVFGPHNCGEFKDRVREMSTLFYWCQANFKAAFLAVDLMEKQIKQLGTQAEDAGTEKKDELHALAARVEAARLGLEQYQTREGAGNMFSSSRSDKALKELLNYQKAIDAIMTPSTIAAELRHDYKPKEVITVDDPPESTDGGDASGLAEVQDEVVDDAGGDTTEKGGNGSPLKSELGSQVHVSSTATTEDNGDDTGKKKVKKEGS